MRPVRRRELACAGVVAVLFTMAPTVGDIGGCGAVATPMDEASFASARKRLDCKRCLACKLDTARCFQACEPRTPRYVAFPPGCKPLTTDGEVCLHAVDAASCGDFAGYVADEDPRAPSECGFCRGPSEGGAP